MTRNQTVRRTKIHRSKALSSPLHHFLQDALGVSVLFIPFCWEGVLDRQAPNVVKVADRSHNVVLPIDQLPSTVK